MKRLAVVFAMLLAAAPARAQEYTFPEWLGLVPDARHAYAMAIFDALMATYRALGLSPRAEMFERCLAERVRSYGPFGDDLATYAVDHAAIHAASIPAIVVAYLQDVCDPAM